MKKIALSLVLIAVISVTGFAQKANTNKKGAKNPPTKVVQEAPKTEVPKVDTTKTVKKKQKVKPKDGFSKMIMEKR